MTRLINLFKKHDLLVIGIILFDISVFCFKIYFDNGLGLGYNDARSHLDIGRRVVEGLKPGLAQIGSVWLPLPHVLMIFTIWNDFMWHSGLSGAIISMISFVGTGLLIYKFLQTLKVGYFGRIVGVFVFAANLNILYLQSTAMTELLLLFTMTFGAYEFLKWYKSDNILSLVKAAFWIMLSTLVRYDGWFLFAWTTGLVFLKIFLDKRKRGISLLKKYIETAIKFARSEHIPLADAYHASLDNSGNGKLALINSGDHIHYSDSGRALMGSKIAQAMIVNKLLE